MAWGSPAEKVEQDRLATLPPALPLPRWVEWAARFDVTAISVDAVWPAGPQRLSAPANTIARGLFGERLRDLRCLTRAPTCDGCRERDRCDYARIFDLAVPGGSEPAMPVVPPYWIQGLPAVVDPGGLRTTVRLHAVGPAIASAPYLDVSLRDALRRTVPIGSPTGPALSASRVDTVDPNPGDAGARFRELRITARSPLVLRGDEKRCREACPQAPWLALLLRAGVRRLARLREAFGVAEAELHAAFPPLDAIEVVAGGMKTWHGSRFSHRQGQRLRLDGLTGSAVLRGEVVPEIAPLLLALTVTSVGKQTTMGFGDLGVEGVG